jgi:hypothetical protein
VLGPHHRVHRELELARITTEEGHDRAELVVGEAEPAVQVGGQGGHVGGSWRHGGRLDFWKRVVLENLDNTVEEFPIIHGTAVPMTVVRPIS